MKPEKKPAMKFNKKVILDTVMNALFIVGIFSFTTMFVPVVSPTVPRQLLMYGILTVGTVLYISKERN